MARPHRRRIVGWIAICAVLLQTFVPLVTHTRAAERSPLWVDVCSTDGIKRVALSVELSGEKPEPTVPGKFPHCPYCVSSATSLGAPPPDRILVFSSIERRHINAPIAVYIRARSVWRTPQSRAPPVA